jgi:diphthamide synthase (EF-2-diphthine--ammonia ligase)
MSSRVALAWAGGIGSLLALDALRRAGRDVTLVHLQPSEGEARAVPPFLVEEQAACLGLPLVSEPAGGNELAAVARALERARCDAVAFGYLRGEDYVGMFKVANAARAGGAEPLLPVRHLRPDDAAHALVAAGHRAFVRSVGAALPRAWLGRMLDAPLVDDVEEAAGRAGWSLVRTLAIDGPLFARRVEATVGDIVPTADGAARVELGLKGC